ncbi:rod shape-determining protein MreC [uncultured Cetobacterium sp.]|uniref:rod shape-determining protein MreC n=1 Tax=uncultured Cetobacterium sp. TaxID=527638 RepID=UPI0026144BB1|nr:rod shape-determining protein MreC [uncultured Cetobacterium sp.]
MRIGKNKKKVFNIIYILIGIIVVIFFAKDVFMYSISEINNVLYPLQSKIYFFGKKAKESTETVLNYKDLVSENTKLKKDILEKSLVEEKNEKLLDENIRLRKLLSMKGEFKYSFKVGKISFQQTRELFESFAINLGSRDKIKKNMPILYGDELIGRVDHVEKDYSTVEMITFQDSIVSARSSGDVLGIIKGNRSDELIFEPVSFHEAHLNIGDKIYTSGISDIYPKGVYIGDVTEIRKKYEDRVEYIVKIPFDITNMNEVIVLTEVDI